MNPIYDPMSGNVFVNLAVGPSADYQWVILDRNDAIGPVSEGHVLGVDGLHNFVYVAVGNDRNRLEIRESATWALAGTQIDTVAYKVAADTALNRLYVMRSPSEVAVFDQASGVIWRRSRSGMASSSTTSRSLLATTASMSSATRHSRVSAFSRYCWSSRPGDVRLTTARPSAPRRPRTSGRRTRETGCRRRCHASRRLCASARSLSMTVRRRAAFSAGRAP